MNLILCSGDQIQGQEIVLLEGKSIDMVYEFITPSDKITCLADDDKVACLCAILLANGKAGCRREDGERLPAMWIFHNDPVPEIEKYLGSSMEEFLIANAKKMGECYLSFAYADFEERKRYDEMLAIAEGKGTPFAKHFRMAHEDENRTSMSRWVQSAWQNGEALLKKSEPSKEKV